MLASLWLYTGLMAYIRIKQGDARSHRRWMVRNYALTYAAVALRIYLPLFLMNGMEFIPAYQTIAWICWVPNIVIAEWIFVRGK